jgi:hypothetical protein
VIKQAFVIKQAKKVLGLGPISTITATQYNSGKIPVK